VLEIHAFGKLRLGYQQTMMGHFPTRQVEELLGFLLLDPQVHHTREKLITLLWPDVDVANGRHRFSIVLSRLRKIFHQLVIPFDDFIHSTRDWVCFDPQQPFFFDRDQFIQHCQDGFRSENLVQREQLLQTAVNLHRADLMEGVYADWCLGERERMARLRLRALGQLMYCCMQRQAYDAAIEHGHAILQDDPLREETYRALMLCYHQQGRSDLAARQYKICADLLQTEFKEIPLSDTTALYVQIMEDRGLLLLDQEPPEKRQDLLLALNTFRQAARRLENLL
jgi:DNA-binding SARP family transcriptional activator